MAFPPRTAASQGAKPIHRLLERHNERLDLRPEVWSEEVIAEAVHRSGRQSDR